MEQLIEERRAQFQREKEAELEERMEEERRESIRRQIIEQERQRLLKEHATKLLGYLPKVSCLVLIILYCIRSLFRHSLSFFLSCIKDCIEDMETFTVLAKIFSMKIFCNSKMAGFGKIFIQ